MSFVDIFMYSFLGLFLLNIYALIGYGATNLFIHLPMFDKGSKTRKKVTKVLLLVFWPLALIFVLVALPVILIQETINSES